MILGKGDRRVEIDVSNPSLIAYYTRLGWDEVDDDAPAEPFATVGEQGPELQTDPLTTKPVDPDEADPPHPSPSPHPHD